jgi:hypothetical protein
MTPAFVRSRLSVNEQLGSKWHTTPLPLTPLNLTTLSMVNTVLPDDQARVTLALGLPSVAKMTLEPEKTAVLVYRLIEHNIDLKPVI